jgi:type IV secretion system protein VirB9
MREINKYLLALGLAFTSLIATNSYAQSTPVAIDSRIKTFIYSENEVFRLVVHYGYQSSIEFADGEEIQTISVGNNYAWQLTPVGRRLFIKPLEENILTNMTIITNKRVYHLEVQSKLLSYTVDEELVYVVRFFYPDKDFDTSKQAVLAQEVEPIPTIKPFNFNYTLTGPQAIAPVKVFDDGTNTFFKFEDKLQVIPAFTAKEDGGMLPLEARKRGDYIVVNKVAPEFELALNSNVVNVFNENLLREGE